MVTFYFNMPRKRTFTIKKRYRKAQKLDYLWYRTKLLNQLLNCYLNINFSEQNEILKNPEDTIDNLRAQPLLSGDVAYPFCEWLMKTYRFTAALNNIDKKFNKKHSSSHKIVERPFAICKARWHYLLFCTTYLLSD